MARVPRSSRVSRDWEKVLSRLAGLGLVVADLRFARGLTTTLWKTGVEEEVASLVLEDFMNGF